MTTLLIAIIVGVMEVGPGVCQVDVLNIDGTLDTSEVRCAHVIQDYKPAGGR